MREFLETLCQGSAPPQDLKPGVCYSKGGVGGLKKGYMCGAKVSRAVGIRQKETSD